MKAVGILGGTFDPIHFGHLITAQALVELRNLEKIVFVPCYISPHKKQIQSSPSQHRLNMVKLAIEDNPCFDYSDYELNKGGISFSIDTLQELKKKYNNLELIIGYDNISKFSTWKEPDELIKIARLVVMQRELDEPIENKDKYYKSAIFVKTPVIQISATDIRARVKNNLPVDYLIPAKVKEYIFDNHLYK